MTVVGPDGRAPDGSPSDEQLAYAMQQARRKLMIEAMRAMREQLQVEIEGARLLLSIDLPESKALQAGVAAACVTATQLMADKLIASFSRQLDGVFKRLDALEAAGAKVTELAAKLDQAIAGFVGAPPLTDAERVDVANAAQLAALGECHDDASFKLSADVAATLPGPMKLPKLDIVCDHNGGDEYGCAECRPPVKP